MSGHDGQPEGLERMRNLPLEGRLRHNRFDDLRRSGLTDLTIDCWGCFSIAPQDESLLRAFGKGVTAPGLALPIMSPGSIQPIGFSYKPDNPRVFERNGKSTICKYEMPRKALNRIH